MARSTSQARSGGSPSGPPMSVTRDLERSVGSVADGGSPAGDRQTDRRQAAGHRDYTALRQRDLGRTSCPTHRVQTGGKGDSPVNGGTLRRPQYTSLQPSNSQGSYEKRKVSVANCGGMN